MNQHDVNYEIKETLKEITGLLGEMAARFDRIEKRLTAIEESLQRNRHHSDDTALRTFVSVLKFRIGKNVNYGLFHRSHPIQAPPWSGYEKQVAQAIETETSA